MFRTLLAARPLRSIAPAPSTFVRTQSFAALRLYSTPPAASPPLDNGEEAIYKKLKERFPGSRLEVQDVSGGCGSFYAILISSPAFKGLTTVKQHKLVNECLKEDIKGIHGLQLKTIPE
ncbi:hypothetical protein CNBB1580 [Cryptococcus deneoformans B-3501A]|uniref:Bola-like protein n=1 Tax=Cryptococcus deneoformans (strain JEC21 / ATCC MYA-565) TaxID=214684 RepID=Q5KLT2_CRYD1|nr:conserved hypothetical protein [Cryptococcus neoformans var. neoformans JEC21]XP_777356.1 hypothetical protein CNBB1580 [Cryptococcus neoformans var. neoformans B-3501A]AAW41933.1 conserved hypothetical protein [Cryptococcus neoformans var. neoformans JEC21]EAL22709.1 hypothetical protein CNBB1580 [Cryptococcus neoformans var. neoformans B-3501A]